MKSFYIFFLGSVLILFLYDSCVAGVAAAAIAAQKEMTAVKIEHDSFTNEKRVFYKDIFHSTERFAPAFSSQILFLKKIDASEQSAVTAFFSLKREKYSHPVQKEAYLKTGDQKFSIDIKSIETKSLTEVTTGTSMVTLQDNSIQPVVTSVFETQRNYDQFTIDLTPEIIASLSQSTECVFRFYLGAEPVSFIIDGAKFEKLRAVLNYQK
ncbi:MAG TPA: hypothetical protein PKC40_02765 [Saprospiraceae bacterium]|nr:hypothetical protein [Saprospiraceae bacterium]